MIDLKEPFELEENNTIKSWKLFGSSRVQEDKLILLPPIRRAHGAIWTDTILPATNWSIRTDILLVEPSETFSFAVFYIKEPTHEFYFHGGPPKIEGLAIIGEFIRENRTHLKFTLNSIQSDGKVDLRTAPLPEPDMSFYAATSTRFGLIISFSDNRIISGIDIGDGNIIKGAEMEAKLDYNQYYLGITALNGAIESGFILENLEVSLNDGAQSNFFFFHGDDPFQVPSQPEYYSVSTEETLQFRGASYREMEKQMTLRKAAHGNLWLGGLYNDTKGDTVLTCIDETLVATSEMGTFSQINEYIKYDLQSYVQKWHKRMTKACRSMQEVRKLIDENRNSATAMLNYYNKSLTSTFEEMFQMSFNFTNELSIMSQQEVPINLPPRISLYSFILIFFCVIELAVTVYLLLHMDEVKKSVKRPFSLL